MKNILIILIQYIIFIVLSYVLVEDIYKAFALGYIISLFFWKLEEITKKS